MGRAGEAIQISPEEEQRFYELCLMAFDYARHNDVENLKIMLDGGLSVNLSTHRGDTLLMLASYHNSIESARLLLEMGASVDARNHRGQTPLAGVCFKGYLDMAKLLVSYGADIDADNGMGMTPYGVAVMFGRYEVAKFLLSHSTSPSLWKRMTFKMLSGVKRVFGKSIQNQ